MSSHVPAEHTLLFCWRRIAVLARIEADNAAELLGEYDDPFVCEGRLL